MQSIIISGGNIEERQIRISQYLGQWGINRFDCIRLNPGEEKSSIGIGAVKNLIRDLNRNPQFSPFNAAIIQNAELLTTEAQNALLKTIEEPPPHARIILECNSPDTLLPTIRSRCFEFTLPKTPDKHLPVEINDLTGMISGTTGEKLKYAEEATLKHGNIPDFIINLTYFLHTELLIRYGIGCLSKTGNDIKIPSGKIGKILKNLIRTNRYLEANINPKTALDAVFI